MSRFAQRTKKMLQNLNIEIKRLVGFITDRAPFMPGMNDVLSSHTTTKSCKIQQAAINLPMLDTSRKSVSQSANMTNVTTAARLV
jgi:hypothetical protein